MILKNKMIKCQNKSTFKSSIAAAAAFSIAVCHKCHMTPEKNVFSRQLKKIFKEF